MSYRRAQRSEFPIRHEFLAAMLGVHRPTISTAANMLQKAGLISYRYGKMTILDPDGLADGACECYEIMEKEFDNVTGTESRLSEKERPEAGIALP